MCRRVGRLAGRVAVVTGASRGLGRAIAAALSREGASVAVAARTAKAGDDTLPGSLQETAAAIRAAGGTALGVYCDVAVEDDLEGFVNEVATGLGVIDVLVNNAAATVPGRPGRRPTASATSLAAVPGVVDVPMRAVRTQFEVNLFAPWRLTQLVLPAMLERGRGWIVNVGSEAARMPGPPAAYGASKLALEHLTRSVAVEVAGRGVAINTLVPSTPIATPGLEWVGGTGSAQHPPTRFADAVVRLVDVDPAVVNGEVLYSEDVLEPGAAPRGWLG
jgi:NAD(P)-dependent dehydrogenase (short-subunit alcohol dehydrogenase family)